MLRADTGAVVKTGRVGAPASYSASPIATGGRIYFANEDGIVAVVRAGKDWELITANDLDEPIFATPRAVGGPYLCEGPDVTVQFRRAVSRAEAGRPNSSSRRCAAPRDRAPAAGRDRFSGAADPEQIRPGPRRARRRPHGAFMIVRTWPP